jgi:hypothetical protein
MSEAIGQPNWVNVFQEMEGLDSAGNLAGLKALGQTIAPLEFDGEAPFSIAFGQFEAALSEAMQVPQPEGAVNQLEESLATLADTAPPVLSLQQIESAVLQDLQFLGNAVSETGLVPGEPFLDGVNALMSVLQSGSGVFVNDYNQLFLPAYQEFVESGSKGPLLKAIQQMESISSSC